MELGAMESVTRKLPAEPASIRMGRVLAGDIARDAGFSGEDVEGIVVATGEALANAVEHGSSRPAQEVELSVVMEDEALIVTVRDTGREVPPVPDDGMRERGFGYVLMRELMDDVEVAPDGPGKRVRLIRFLAARG